MWRVLPCLLIAACAADSAPVVPAVADATLWLSPASASAGAPRVVTIDGWGVDFQRGDVDVHFGEGIDVTMLIVDSSFRVRAQVTVQDGAALGVRDVTVSWHDGLDYRILRDAFVVESGSVDLSPRSGALGETVRLDVSGWGTQFLPGITFPNLGPGIDISDVVVVSSSHLRFLATIDPRTDIGARDLVVQTGPSVVTHAAAFVVDRDARTIDVSPPFGDQGQSLQILITADEGGFAPGLTALDLGTGIVVDEVVVETEDKLSAAIRIGNNARVGPRDVVAETPSAGGLRVRVAADAFTVRPVEANPLRARVTLSLSISRVWDPERCVFSPRVFASASFYEPNDFPCPSNPGSSTMGVPVHWDVAATGFVQPSVGSTDCPSPKTFDAGAYVEFVAADDVIRLPRLVDTLSGRVSYVHTDLTVDDYLPAHTYALLTPGGDLGWSELPPWNIEDALRTLPRDFQQSSPDACRQHAIDETIAVRWSPGETYDSSDMYLYLTGAPTSEGFPVLYVYPWDDGAYDIEPAAFEHFESGGAELSHVALRRTVFAVPGSELPNAGFGSSTSLFRSMFVLD